jgi:hypothetical protein
MTPELPPGVPVGGPDVGDDPVAAEARGLALLEQTRSAIVDGVARCLPGWVERSVASILEAWGRADADTSARARAAAHEAAPAVAARVSAALDALLALDPSEQRATPLEIVRSAYREPTAILLAAGVPDVVRDDFATRAWPADRYGLVPATLGDLGDPDLAPLQLAWGVGKSTVLRARAARGTSR